MVVPNLELSYKDLYEIVKRLSSEFEPKPEVFQMYEFSVINDSYLYKYLLGKPLQPFIFIQNYIKVESNCQEYEEPSKLETLYQEESYSFLEGEEIFAKPLSIDVDMSSVISCRSTGKKSFSPIFADDARFLISLYTQICNEELIEGLLPMWVLCDGSDPEKTAFIGCEMIYESKKLIIISITIEGSYSMKNKLPSLAALKSRFSWKNVGHISLNGFAQYDAFDTLHEDSNDRPSSSVLITCQWDKVNSVLEKPPLDAKSFVDMKIIPNDVRSPVFFIYRELKILQGFIEGLTTGEITWTNESFNQLLSSNICKLLDDLKKDIPKISTNEKEELDMDAPLQSTVVLERNDLDFTELLWKIFIDCSSYQQLIEGLEVVLKNLKNGEIQPKVHKNNKSVLAQLIKDSYYGKMNMPKLNGLLPLQILVEIGLNKIKADCLNTFIGEELVTMSHLEPFITLDLNYQDQLTGLMKLHHVLELVAIGKLFLKLPQTTLTSFARNGLQHYSHHDIDPHFIFHFPVSMSSVNSLCEISTPILWKVGFQKKSITENTDSEDSAIFQISTKPFFEYLFSYNNEDANADFKFFTTTVVQREVSLLLQ